jgi:hypothetical protein
MNNPKGFLMKNLKTTLSGCILLLMMVLTLKSSACTSLILKTKDGLYFVHSLNQGDWKSVPGLIFVNQRDAWKKGYSWEALLKVNDESAPSLVWKSKYGSVTFNPLGKEFPDGGMNEKGLYIWEMSFAETKFPDDPNKPKLFMMQWMQYQLDNFSTIGEVMKNAGQMSLDGWEWHFFVADRSGTVKYPSSDGMTELPMTLVIAGKNDGFAGTVNDNVVIKNRPMTSIIHKGGLLSFIVQVQESGDALYYQLSVSTHEIKGTIDIFGERRKATLHLRRKT